MQTKEYLSFESARNKTYAPLYTAIVQKALGKVEVLIGHHLCFEAGGDIATENEIPSADTLIFDHDIMDKVFGERAHWIMSQLAMVPAAVRDSMLQRFWDAQVKYDTIAADLAAKPMMMSAATE